MMMRRQTDRRKEFNKNLLQKNITKYIPHVFSMVKMKIAVLTGHLYSSGLSFIIFAMSLSLLGGTFDLLFFFGDTFVCSLELETYKQIKSHYISCVLALNKYFQWHYTYRRFIWF